MPRVDPKLPKWPHRRRRWRRAKLPVPWEISNSGQTARSVNSAATWRSPIVVRSRRSSETVHNYRVVVEVLNKTNMLHDHRGTQTGYY